MDNLSITDDGYNVGYINRNGKQFLCPETIFLVTGINSLPSSALPIRGDPLGERTSDGLPRLCGTIFFFIPSGYHLLSFRLPAFSSVSSVSSVFFCNSCRICSDIFSALSSADVAEFFQRPYAENNFSYDLLLCHAAYGCVSGVDRGFPVVAHYEDT